MNRGLYAPCSVFTRRQTSDVFHNDPFKVQSYNFRYAERPVYPVQHYQRPPPKQPESPPFMTYYYNARFNRNQESPKSPLQTSSFAETRRRQFLQDFNPVSTPVKREIVAGLRPSVQQREVLQMRHPVVGAPPAVASNPPLLRSCCNRDDYQTMRRGQSVTTMRQSNSNTSPSRTGSRCASVCSFRQPEKSVSQSTIKLFPRRSASSCSGCAININIRAMDSDADLDKSLRIKIETDSSLHNNTDKFKVQANGKGQGPGQETQKCRVTRCLSSESFVIDKRLSKFSMADVPASSRARNRTSEQDALQAKRLQVQLERERLENMRQQELKREQERARQREKERERLRQAERHRDHERLLELEAERENQRLRELERETQRKREIERLHQEKLRQERQQRMPMRAMSMPIPNSSTPPVVMTSHLCRRASTDRLPGMAPCYVRNSTANSKSDATRAQRLHNCTRNLTTLQMPPMRARSSQEKPVVPQSPAPQALERRSSGTSNYNASVTGSGSNTSMRQLSATRLNERKLLNLHVNGVPVSSNLPIHARLNNMPIRISTSQPVDEHLQFSVHRIRVANASPMATASAVQARRGSRNSSRSCSRISSRSGLEEPHTMPCNVNINVYADNPRSMRL